MEKSIQTVFVDDDNEKSNITHEESSFGNMNYYQKKEEYIKKHLWKTAAQVDYDITEAMKRIIRG